MFQHYINNTLHNFLDVFVTAYIDNILIYSNSLSEHQKHVWWILKQLWKADLQCDIWKCKFHVNEIMYFELIVFNEDIKMNSAKMKVIIEWENSCNVCDVWAFFRFANFYWWFIRWFLKIVWFMMNLTKKNISFCWTVECECVFNDLKKWFMTAFILAHFDSDLEYVLETDSSDHA